MSQSIDIGDYVNLKLDQNDMATSIGNLNNNYMQGGQQMIDIIDQMENVQQTQPISTRQMMQQQQPPQQMMQAQQQSQLQHQPLQMMQQHQQPQQMMQQHQVPQKQMMAQNIKQKILNQVNKEINSDSDHNLNLSDSEKHKSLKEPSKMKIILKDTILVIILFLIFGNKYIDYILETYVSFLSLPLVILGLKTLVISLLFFLVKYYLL